MTGTGAGHRGVPRRRCLCGKIPGSGKPIRPEAAMRTGSSAGLRSKLTSFVRRDRRKRLAAVIFMPLAVGKLPFRAPPPGAQLLGGRRSAEGTAVRKPATDTWRGSLRTTFEDISVSANAIPVASPYSPVICAPLTAGKRLKSKDFRCFLLLSGQCASVLGFTHQVSCG